MLVSCLLALLLALFSPALASLSFSYGEKTIVTVPTQDLFQATTPAFAHSGFPIQLVMQTGATCQIVPEIADPTNGTALGLQQAYTESILYAVWNEAEMAGCITFNDLGQAALAYNDTLAGAATPGSRTLIVVMPPAWSQGPFKGNPNIIPAYMAHKASKSDGPVRGLAMALVASDDFDDFVKAGQDAPPPPSGPSNSPKPRFTLLQEPGPWNDVFIDVEFQAVNLCFLLLNVIFLLHACYRLVPVIIKRELALDLRNGVFLLGLVSSGLYMGTFTMRIISLSTFLLRLWSSYLGSLAFQMILYMWSNVLMQIRPHRYLNLLRGIIGLAFLLVTTSTCIHTVRITQNRPSDAMNTASFVVIYGSIIAQLIIGSIFLAYSVQFRKRRDTVKVSAETYRALSKLTYLAWIAFFSYLGLAIGNLPPLVKVASSPVSFAILTSAMAIFASARSFALLSILGVRVPNKSTTLGPSALASGQTSGSSSPSSLPTYHGGYVSYEEDQRSYKSGAGRVQEEGQIR
ncbi:hypothetical protein BJ684DRAFT_19659 [Piptocephalis cylindrospora]|uniref:Lung seven transmembrane receptor-domain-containing protein n=1 Tax=Piptocephalis cylindrospora TaxID=1907219 RepID=A0A4P9Y6N8_9FUNG|nr:hypothetical protein BJ684DRAFT_19659 [Piptocephalis cylindrospora]|eukprot:RKP13891.1 hypothetical protein BJ684DRAFT_19659 [Piptocephalis cylindrospora]